MDCIPKEVEDKIVGQKLLFKVQVRNRKEFYRNYPYTVNKLCSIPEIVEKHVPVNIGSQIFNYDVKLSDILFGSDIAEVILLFHQIIASVFLTFCLTEI